MATPLLLRDDAVWTWFQDPRAVRVGDLTFIGFSTTVGIYIGQYNNVSGAWNEFQLRATGADDDHAVASIGIRPDGRLIAAYSEHNDSAMRIRVSTNTLDATTWEAETTITIGGGSFTYPNLVYLSAESRWFLFFREFPDACFATSDDQGVTWSGVQTLITPTGQRPYVKVASDGVSRIHFLVTDGHPNEVQNSVYHFSYDAGVYRNSAGTSIGANPVAHASMTKVHDGSGGGNNSWVWDIALAGTSPVVAYTTFPSINDHRYWYGRLDGATWVTHELAPAGGKIASSSSEVYYTCGIILDHDDPRIIYLGLPRGTELWDIEQWVTSDGGASWAAQPVVTGGKNMRPVAVRGGSPAVIWFAGTYGDYTVFTTSMYWAEVTPIFPGAPAGPGPIATAVVRRQVTWLACSLTDGAVIAELPDLRGEFSRVIGRYTSSSITLPIPIGGGVPVALALQATEPARTMLVAVVNDIPTWAGICLPRTGGTDAELANGLVSPEGYLEHRFVHDHTWVQQDEAAIIAAGLLADAGDMAGVGNGINLAIDAPATGRLRDRTYLASDHKTVYEALTELMAVENGPEWTIDLDWTSVNHTAVQLIARVRSRIGTANNTPPIFDTLATTDARYELLEEFSGDAYANYVVAYSSGEGESQPTSAPAIDTAALATGAPIWEQHFQPSTSIVDQATLDAHAAAQLARVRAGSLRWTLTARWDVYPRYGVDWRLGDDIRWIVRGHRHPAGVDARGRAFGFALDPAAGIIRPILQEDES